MYDDTFTVERAREYHQATYSIGMGAARRFHRQVDLSGRSKIMDLGGGSGCYCIVAATAGPGIKAEVLAQRLLYWIRRRTISPDDTL